MVTHNPATVDMSDYPQDGLPFDDPYLYPAHDNTIVSGKALAQIQNVAIEARRSASPALRIFLVQNFY